MPWRTRPWLAAGGSKKIGRAKTPQKERRKYSNLSIFRCKLLVSGRVDIKKLSVIFGVFEKHPNKKLYINKLSGNETTTLVDTCISTKTPRNIYPARSRRPEGASTLPLSSVSKRLYLVEAVVGCTQLTEKMSQKSASN